MAEGLSFDEQRPLRRGRILVFEHLVGKVQTFLRFPQVAFDE